MNNNLQKIIEYRGVTDFVIAEVLVDTAAEFTCGPVYAVAGVNEIEKETESSSETHYYNNGPAIVVQTTGSDKLTVKSSAIPLDVLAFMTGQKYDAGKGAFIERKRKQRYFACGYKTTDTDDAEYYVWRYKGSFGIPKSTHHTDDESTDANGQDLEWTGVQTIHKFTNAGDDGPEPARAMTVEVSLGLADVSTFFDQVTDPDMLQAATPSTMRTVTNTLTKCTTNTAAASVVDGQPYAALISPDSGYTLGAVSVTMGGSNISSSAVSGGAITVPSVTGNLVISCTATDQN